MKIIVPATSANIGPGFDSVGVALSKYLEIEVLEESQEWVIEHDLNPRIPKDRRNLLVKIALQLAPDIQPRRLKMTSDIPLARGLGSSSSVIVAGIELANQLAHLNLSDYQKLKIATKIEGHPDNVAPAIYGNLVVSSSSRNQVSAVVADFPDADFIAYIPDYELRTVESQIAGRAIESDLFHEKYRQPLIKEFSDIKFLARKNGSYATYISGAGPTVMVLSPKHKTETIYQLLQKQNFKGQIFRLQVDTEGVRVEK